MKKLIALATLMLVVPVILGAGAILRSEDEGQGIEFWTFPSGGSLQKSAEIDDEGTLVVEKIENAAGDPPPGMVPIGGMIAIVNTGDADQWTPPATGVIKDGFMLADGNGTIPSGPLAGAAVPNMNSMVRGVATFAGATGGGGSDTADIAHGHGFTQPSGHTVTVPGHYHSEAGAGAGLTLDDATHTHTVSVSGNKNQFNLNQSDPGNHSHSITNGQKLVATAALRADFASSDPFYYRGDDYDSFTHDGAHMHTWTSTFSASGTSANPVGMGTGISGTVGLVSGGSNGNAGFSASVSNNHSGGAVVSLGATNVDTVSAYNNVIWVIRVL